MSTPDDDSEQAPEEQTEDRLPLPQDSQEVTHSPRTGADDFPQLASSDTSAPFATFLKFHPFMSLFCSIAHVQYPSNEPRERRV